MSRHDLLVLFFACYGVGVVILVAVGCVLAVAVLKDALTRGFPD